MKTLIFILILFSFLQTAIFPINLVLLVILARGLVLEDNSNYYLAFLEGLILGILSGVNLGFWPLTFLVVIKLAHILRKLPLITNLITIFPLSLVIIYLVSQTESLFFSQSINLLSIFISAIIFIPIYIVVRFWEERFIVRPTLKLKV